MAAFDCLLVDGYNIINAWEDLRKECSHSLDSARELLIDRLSSYKGYVGCRVLVVFDAHYVNRSMEKTEHINGIEVVFTKEGESADNFIERFVYLNKNNYDAIGVVTSDYLQQLMILGAGAVRLTPGELRADMNKYGDNIKETYKQEKKLRPNTLESRIDDKILKELEKLRRGNE